MLGAVHLEQVLGLGRFQPLRNPLKIDNLRGLADEGESIPTPQYPAGGDGREHVAVPLQLDQVDPLQVPQPCLGHGHSVEGATRNDFHLGREFIEVLGELLQGSLSVG